MSFSFGKELPVKDGLIFYLDVVNPTSYLPNSNYWKSIVKDVSVGNFDATYPPVFNPNYNGKKAIEFNGTDTFLSGSFNTASFGGQNYLDLNTSNKTIEILFSVTTNPVSARGMFTVGFDSSDFQYSIGVSQVNDRLAIWSEVAGSGSRVDLIVPNAEYSKYYLLHYVFANDPDTNSILVNGVALDKHQFGTTNLPINSWYVGLSKTAYYSGSINYIKVYNRALTGPEISKIFTYVSESRNL